MDSNVPILTPNSCPEKENVMKILYCHPLIHIRIILRFKQGEHVLLYSSTKRLKTTINIEEGAHCIFWWIYELLSDDSYYNCLSILSESTGTSRCVSRVNRHHRATWQKTLQFVLTLFRKTQKNLGNLKCYHFPGQGDNYWWKSIMIIGAQVLNAKYSQEHSNRSYYCCCYRIMFFFLDQYFIQNILLIHYIVCMQSHAHNLE